MLSYGRRRSWPIESLCFLNVVELMNNYRINGNRWYQRFVVQASRLLNWKKVWEAIEITYMEARWINIFITSFFTIMWYNMQF
jgi:hypothetical protein